MGWWWLMHPVLRDLLTQRHHSQQQPCKDVFSSSQSSNAAQLAQPGIWWSSPPETWIFTVQHRRSEKTGCSSPSWQQFYIAFPIPRSTHDRFKLHYNRFKMAGKLWSNVFQNQKNGVPWEQLSCKALASAFPRKRSLERPQDSIYLAFLDLTSAFTAFLGAGVRGISSFSASFSILRSLAFRWLRNGLRSWMMTMIVHCHMDLTCAILIVQLVVTIYGQQNHM